MPGCNAFNAKENMLLMYYYGIVTADDLHLQLASVYSNPALPKCTRQLAYFLDVEGYSSDVNLEQLSSFADMNKSAIQQYPSDRKLAFVANDSFTLKLLAIYQEHATTHEIPDNSRLFTQYKEAIAWVGGESESWQKLLEEVSGHASQ